MPSGARGWSSRGHQVIVTNPGLTDFIEVDTGDSADLIAIYPHPGHVVLPQRDPLDVLICR
ncbi:MAG: hypothetical protein ACRDRP_18465 [Pseudonocardiaceae bacterium]